MSPGTSNKPVETASATRQPASRSWWFLYGDIVFFLGLFLFVVWHGHGNARLAGIIVGSPAFLLWFVAKLNLGEFFTLSAQARHLVTRGLYSKIRHPIYFFSTLALFAIALCLHSLLLYIYVVLVAGVQIWRARAEERVLLERFGDAYREYRERTWF